MTLTTMLLCDAVDDVGKGSPDQARDDHGRFGSGGAGQKPNPYDSAKTRSMRAAFDGADAVDASRKAEDTGDKQDHVVAANMRWRAAQSSFAAKAPVAAKNHERLARYHERMAGPENAHHIFSPENTGAKKRDTSKPLGFDITGQKKKEKGGAGSGRRPGGGGRGNNRRVSPPLRGAPRVGPLPV